MSLASDRRNAYRQICYAARRIPGEHGLREHTVSVVTAAWSGSHAGDGTETETITSITESSGYPPKVRWLTDEQTMVGGLDSGTIEVGPITPEHNGGGTAFSTLVGAALTDGQTIQLLITGPMHPTGARYVVTKHLADRALRHMLQAKPVTH